MRLRNIVKLLSVGVIALVMAGCGGGGGDSSGTTPTPPPEETLPIGPSGNYLLLPGYEYEIEGGDTFEMIVLSTGNVLFGGTCHYKAFDANYNPYNTHEYSYKEPSNIINNSNTYDFTQGTYYINVDYCYGGNSKNVISVESNVL